MWRSSALLIFVFTQCVLAQAQQLSHVNLTAGYNYYYYQQDESNTLLNHGPRIGIGVSFFTSPSTYSRFEYNAIFFQEDYNISYVTGLDYEGEIRQYSNFVLQNQFLFVVTGGLNFINFKFGIDWDVLLNKKNHGINNNVDERTIIYSGEEDKFHYHTINFHMGMAVNFKQRLSLGVDAIIGMTDWYEAGTPAFDPTYYDFAGKGIRRSMWSVSLTYWLFKDVDE